MNFAIVFIHIVLLTNQILFIKCESKECIHKDYNHGSTVCVCNATYCDTVDPVSPLSKGQYVMYSSNKDGLRFYKTTGSFQEEAKQADITIDSTVKYQNITGWGGAFTDSASYMIHKLNDEAKQNLLRTLFSKEGIEYSMARVQIGCSDFSMRYYSLDDNAPGDINLTHFNLSTEDYNLRIPLIKEALALSNNTLRLFGSTWTPPIWMKTNNQFYGMGFLKKEYYQTWADYHVKFLDLYREHNISFWGLTTGNEPSLGLTNFFTIPGLGWAPWDQGKWIINNLGPAIKNSPIYKNVKIIALDDERIMLPFWMLMMNDGRIKKYIDGIGTHWYTDNVSSSVLFKLTNFFYPNMFFLGTEACTGDMRYNIKILLGSWRRAEEYVEDILDDVDNLVGGWVDWNLALNTEGGPTINKNYVESSILINETAQEFYKQPTFYALGHFSKFIPPESVKISGTAPEKYAQASAFLRPDGGVVVVIYNRHSNDHNITIYDERRGYVTVPITKRSVNTLLYW